MVQVNVGRGRKTGVITVFTARRFFVLGAICLIGWSSLAGPALAARTVYGTFVSAAGDKATIRTDPDGKPLTFAIVPDAVLLRGQMGSELRKAKLAEFGAGDRVVVVINDKGLATSLKGYYAIARGTIVTVKPDKIFFRDGRSVKLRPGMPVVFGDGLVGRAADLRPGAEVICRINPITNEAWTIVVKQPKSAKVSVEPYKPNVVIKKPVIESVTYTAPEVIRPRDWIKVVVTGTPGGRAVCQVKGLIPRTVMQETSPGVYVAHVQVPSNKVVKGEPLVAYLTVGGVDAVPVQASRLISVTTEQPPEAIKPPADIIVPKPEPEPVQEEKREVPPDQPKQVTVAPPAPAEQPKVEEPHAKKPIVITSPEPGARIKRVLTVTGIAEPGLSVMVTVSYTNCLAGILNLSGQVISQLVAVGADGQFKLGPIPLEGPLATRGLLFTVKAYYPDSAEPAASVSVFGERD
ncbi:MAG: hypothetical protein QHI38_09150 [Armatimonadota bacterium]|nr:hypothetical protein [Armatimonadota bacterium]